VSYAVLVTLFWVARQRRNNWLADAWLKPLAHQGEGVGMAAARGLRKGGAGRGRGGRGLGQAVGMERCLWTCRQDLYPGGSGRRVWVESEVHAGPCPTM
jgi:hypothetical protein